MINPYREAAPWARAITLVVLGAVILYGLGRWDQHVDTQLEDLKRDTGSALRVTAALRAHRDSIRRVEDSLATVDAALARQEMATTDALAALDSVVQAETDSVESAHLADLLRPLRMRSILHEDDTLYATDGDGVRFLSRRMLRLDQVERELGQVRQLADTRAERVAVLLVSLTAAQTRADTAEARIAGLEPLLERWQEQSSCKILWLVPCPSRTTTFVVGLVAGGTIAYLGSRE